MSSYRSTGERRADERRHDEVTEAQQFKIKKRACDVCQRTDEHTHCPECGSTKHVAASCDIEG